jgi:hypothetical protein
LMSMSGEQLKMPGTIFSSSRNIRHDGAGLRLRYHLPGIACLVRST